MASNKGRLCGVYRHMADKDAVLRCRVQSAAEKSAAMGSAALRDAILAYGRKYHGSKAA